MSEWKFKVIDPSTREFVYFDDNCQPFEYYVRGTKVNDEGIVETVVIGAGHNLDDAFDNAHLNARLEGIESYGKR